MTSLRIYCVPWIPLRRPHTNIDAHLSAAEPAIRISLRVTSARRRAADVERAMDEKARLVARDSATRNVYADPTHRRRCDRASVDEAT
jgi:hypothetical protein